MTSMRPLRNIFGYESLHSLQGLTSLERCLAGSTRNAQNIYGSEKLWILGQKFGIIMFFFPGENFSRIFEVCQKFKVNRWTSCYDIYCPRKSLVQTSLLYAFAQEHLVHVSAIKGLFFKPKYVVLASPGYEIIGNLENFKNSLVSPNRLNRFEQPRNSRLLFS